ncbi:alpha/beta hydrolase [Virgibacillus kekensis]|uniref:Alpha/beta hydrolase n=1 Tax=Virgibacillus kekensis TaxID=202261 RepID=A0ABV9DL01_9BACI
MRKRDGHFSGIGNEKLYYRVFAPKTKQKGAVIVVHGIGDHNGGLFTLCKKLTAKGYKVYAYDLRGHGNSTGIRGHINDWAEFREDLHLFIQLVSKKIGALPLYLAGHSLGGVIMLDYLVGRGEGLAGAIAIAPVISYEPSWYEKMMIRVMGKLKPDYLIEQEQGDVQLTKSPDKLDMLRNDSLRHNWVSPGLGRELMRTIVVIKERADLIEIPFLLQYGQDDEITPAVELRDFFERVGSNDKEKKEYPNLQHRPFDGIDTKQFFDDLNSWLKRH